MTGDPPFCDLFGNFCFYLFMFKFQKDVPSNSDCNCLSDCQKISYSISESRRPIGKDFFSIQRVHFNGKVRLG